MSDHFTLPRVLRDAMRLSCLCAMLALAACGGGGSAPPGPQGCTWNGSNWNQCNWQ